MNSGDSLLNTGLEMPFTIITIKASAKAEQSWPSLKYSTRRAGQERKRPRKCANFWEQNEYALIKVTCHVCPYLQGPLLSTLWSL